MPLWRRVPKFGFTNTRRVEYAVINLRDLERFKDGTVVDLSALQNEGLLKKSFKGPFKILAKGEIKKPLTVKATAFSKTAMEAIQKAGGKTEIVAR